VGLLAAVRELELEAWSLELERERERVGESARQSIGAGVRALRVGEEGGGEGLAGSTGFEDAL
jgi:hypothetical protein